MNSGSALANHSAVKTLPSSTTAQPPASDATEDALANDMLTLFLPEAEEWLGQINAALRELEAGPSPSRATTLRQAIRSAATNLGGSAATVRLPRIESLSHALFLSLEALESQAPSASTCASLRAAFAEVETAVLGLKPSPPATDLLTELFLPEAEEWLSQIDAILQEMEAGPSPSRATTLRQAIRSAATNLGGSAATVGLPRIESLSFALLLPLEALENQVPSVRTCAPLRAAFAEVETAILHVTPSPSAGAPAANSSTPADAGSSPAEGAHRRWLAAALGELQTSRTHSSHYTKDWLASIVEQVRGEEAFDEKAILRCLDDMVVLDERLLTEADARVPAIAEVLSRVRAGDANGALTEAFRDVRQLRQAAEESGMFPAVRLLQGLESFMTIVGRSRATVPSDRYAAVQDQLNSMLPLLLKWAQASQSKREVVERGLRPRQTKPASSLGKKVVLL